MAMSSSNGSSDAYYLPRNATESARLEAQHRVWVTNIGYLFHPAIAASLPDQATIGEVATGTGIWLLDHARSSKTHGRTHHYIGLDLSPAQFPSKHPSNVSFDTLNILEPIPKDWHGRFDALHVRLLVCGLAGDDWPKAARNLMTMLRPGGWLQWEELDQATIEVKQAVSGTSGNALAQLAHTSVGLAQSIGRFGRESAELDRILSKAGYVDVQWDVFASDRIGERPAFSAASLAACEALMKSIINARGEKEAGFSIKEVEALGSKAKAVAERGEAYMRADLVVTVAQRPK